MSNSVSMKTAIGSSRYVFYVGYCELQFLFSPSERLFYNAGIYGWNCDIFHHYVKGIGLCVLTTGYRNMKGRRIPDSIVKKYNNAAKDIKSNWNIPYDEIRNRIYKLQSEMFTEIING